MARKKSFIGEGDEDSDSRLKKKVPGLFNPVSRRFQVLCLTMLGLFSLVYIRANLGFSMTCMVNSTAILLKKIETEPFVEQNGQFKHPPRSLVTFLLL